MRNIWKEYLENLEAREQAYIEWDNKYKQTYWNEIFCAWLFPLNSMDFPVNIWEYKRKIQHMELDFERFILGIIEAMTDIAGYDISVENIFILDDQVQKTLEISNNSEQIKNNILDKLK